ncbi:MAG: hypothetical protein ACRDQ7_05300, partial [Haloechinothrix sp.]
MTSRTDTNSGTRADGKAGTSAGSPLGPRLPRPLARLVSSVGSSPLRRHLTLAALGLVVVVVVLESTGPFRNAQFASMAYLAIAAGGLTVLTGLNGQLSL